MSILDRSKHCLKDRQVASRVSYRLALNSFVVFDMFDNRGVHRKTISKNYCTCFNIKSFDCITSRIMNEWGRLPV